MTKEQLINQLTETLNGSERSGRLTNDDKKKRLQEIEDVKNMSEEDFKDLLSAGQRFNRKVRSSI